MSEHEHCRRAHATYDSLSPFFLSSASMRHSWSLQAQSTSSWRFVILVPPKWPQVIKIRFSWTRRAKNQVRPSLLFCSLILAECGRLLVIMGEMANCYVTAQKVLVLKMKGNATKGGESAENRFSNRRVQSSLSRRPSTSAQAKLPPPWKREARQEFGSLTPFSSCPDSTIYADFVWKTGDHYERKDNVVNDHFGKESIVRLYSTRGVGCSRFDTMQLFPGVLSERCRFIDRFDATVIKSNPLANYPPECNLMQCPPSSSGITK
jgi:hypothetical protein